MKEKYIFEYEVIWYFEGERKIARGILQATSFTKAVKKLENTFGQDLNSIEHLAYVTDMPTLEIGVGIDDKDVRCVLVPKDMLTPEMLDELNHIHLD